MLKLSVAPPYLDASLAMSDPAQLDTWLRQCPLGQPLECAELLRQALEQLNRVRLPPAQRARLLERHQQEHKILLPLLERLAVNGELSTQHRARHAARLAQQLMLALHNGYKLLLLDRNAEHGLLALEKYKTEAMCLVMRSARQLAFLYARTYTNLPEGFWLDCHSLFFHILEKGWENTQLPGQTKSPAHYYRQILLLGMTACNRMSPVLIDYTLPLIRKHAGLLDLLHLGQLSSGHGSFAFQPGMDQPPRYISEAPDTPSAQGIWVLDTHALEAELKSKLQKLQYLARHQGNPFELEEEIQHVRYLSMEWQSSIQRRHALAVQRASRTGQQLAHHLVHRQWHRVDLPQWRGAATGTAAGQRHARQVAAHAATSAHQHESGECQRLRHAAARRIAAPPAARRRAAAAT